MPLLETRGLTRRFPGVLALDHVDFAAEAGEVHAVCGANGAGKSTLMNILAGTLPASAGTILLDGEAAAFAIARRCARRRHRHRLPGVQLDPRAHRRRQHLSRPRVHPRPGLVDRGRARDGRARAAEALRHPSRRRTSSSARSASPTVSSSSSRARFPPRPASSSSTSRRRCSRSPSRTSSSASSARSRRAACSSSISRTGWRRFSRSPTA